MAKTTKRQGVARKSDATRANKTAPANAASHILPAAKGPRKVSHRQIKDAVEAVFRERLHARA